MSSLDALDREVWVNLCISVMGWAVRITKFEWDDGNMLHLVLAQGIEAEEAEEVFAIAPLIRKTMRGLCAARSRPVPRDHRLGYRDGGAPVLSAAPSGMAMPSGTRKVEESPAG